MTRRDLFRRTVGALAAIHAAPLIRPSQGPEVQLSAEDARRGIQAAMMDVRPLLSVDNLAAYSQRVAADAHNAAYAAIGSPRA